MELLLVRSKSSDSATPISWDNGRVTLENCDVSDVRPSAEMLGVDPLTERRNMVKGLHEFAQWAFGPTGIPTLQLIAFGDFSQKCRFEQTNALLCRNSGGSQYYRRIETGDIVLQELLEKHSDFMGACPMFHILESTMDVP